MSINLQQHIYTIISQSGGLGFLAVSVKSTASNSVELSFSSLQTAVNLSHIFFASDISLYLGIIAVILTLGVFYKTTQTAVLAMYLLKVSAVFVYLSVILNLIGLYSGFEFLASHNILLFNGTYSFTMFSQIFKVLTLLVAAALYALFPHISASNMRLLELPLLLQITLALCITLLSSSNLALMLLSLEGFSLILYIMTALGRTYGGITASVKYFTFGTLGSIFLFWGAVHFYALSPSLSFEVINAMLQGYYSEDESFAKSLDFATSAFTLGFMLKLGAAPTHQWVADVYSGVHMYITAFFSIFVKFVLFTVFISIALNFNCDTLLNQFIIFSLVIGCFMSINQTEIKRLLAYSSVVHVAFLFMGDATSSLVYLLTYVITSIVLFSVLLNANLAGRELIYLNDLKFLRSSGSFNVFCIVTALASSAGLPPFAGFYGKFLVWSSLIEDIYLSGSISSYLILFLSIAVSLVTIYYYMRVAAYLFIGQDAETKGAFIDLKLNQDFHSIVLSTQGLLITLLIFWSFVQPYALSLVQLALLSV